MPNDKQDEILREQLDEELLGELFRERNYKELGDKNCRDLLEVMVEGQWIQHSCQRHGRPKPTKDDALAAFDALKFQLFTKDIKPLDLTLSETRRLILMSSKCCRIDNTRNTC